VTTQNLENRDGPGRGRSFASSLLDNPPQLPPFTASLAQKFQPPALPRKGVSRSASVAASPSPLPPAGTVWRRKRFLFGRCLGCLWCSLRCSWRNLQGRAATFQDRRQEVNRPGAVPLQGAGELHWVEVRPQLTRQRLAADDADLLLDEAPRPGQAREGSTAAFGFEGAVHDNALENEGLANGASEFIRFESESIR
jgi:hypothetical protein